MSKSLILSKKGGRLSTLALNEQAPQQWNPQPQQVPALKALLARGCTALWLDPGGGKTSVVLAAFKLLKKEKLARKMLVIAPLRPCYLVWPKERDKWEDFSDLRIVILHGDNKDELARQPADIYVLNPDGIPWMIQSGFIQKMKPDTLCVDESSQFKHVDTQRFRRLRTLLHLFARRWTLTGTPSSNGYMDVFGQAYITDMGNALSPYINSYRNSYFDPTGNGGYSWALRDGAEKLIQKRLKPIVVRVDMSDFVHVPQFVEHPIFVDLPPKVRKVYDEVEGVMFAQLESMRTITALSVAAAMQKCSQIACGGVYLDDVMNDAGLKIKFRGLRDVSDLHEEKIEALSNLHEELGYKPLLVAYQYHHDLARLRKRFGDDIPVLGGRGSGAAAMRYDMDLEKKWNRGELPLLFGHPASVGHGLNLQEAGNDVCWHSLTYDLELYLQFNRRVGRQGNKNKYCRVHQIIARSTVDEAMLSALHRKDADQRRLLNALRDYSALRGHELPELNLKPLRKGKRS